MMKLDVDETNRNPKKSTPKDEEEFDVEINSTYRRNNSVAKNQELPKNQPIMIGGYDFPGDPNGVEDDRSRYTNRFLPPPIAEVQIAKTNPMIPSNNSHNNNSPTRMMMNDVLVVPAVGSYYYHDYDSGAVPEDRQDDNVPTSERRHYQTKKEEFEDRQRNNDDVPYPSSGSVQRNHYKNYDCIEEYTRPVLRRHYSARDCIIPSNHSSILGTNSIIENQSSGGDVDGAVQGIVIYDNQKTNNDPIEISRTYSNMNNNNNVTNDAAVITRRMPQPQDRVIVLGQDIVRKNSRNIITRKGDSSATSSTTNHNIVRSHPKRILGTGDAEVDSVMTQILKLQPQQADKLKQFLFIGKDVGGGIVRSMSITTADSTNILSLHPAQIQQMEKLSKQQVIVQSNEDDDNRSVQTDATQIVSRRNNADDIASNKSNNNSSTKALIHRNDTRHKGVRCKKRSIEKYNNMKDSQQARTVRSGDNKHNNIINGTNYIDLVDKDLESEVDSTFRDIILGISMIPQAGMSSTFDDNRSRVTNVDENIAITDQNRLAMVNATGTDVDPLTSTNAEPEDPNDDVKPTAESERMLGSVGELLLTSSHASLADKINNLVASLEPSTSAMFPVYDVEAHVENVTNIMEKPAGSAPRVDKESIQPKVPLTPKQPKGSSEGLRVVSPTIVAATVLPAEKAIVNELTTEDGEKKKGTTKGLNAPISPITIYKPVVNEEIPPVPKATDKGGMVVEKSIVSGRELTKAEVTTAQPAVLPVEGSHQILRQSKSNGNILTPPKPEDLNERIHSFIDSLTDGKYLDARTSNYGSINATEEQYEGKFFAFPPILPVVTGHSLLDGSVHSTQRKQQLQPQRSFSQCTVDETSTYRKICNTRSAEHQEQKRNVVKVIGIPVAPIAESISLQSSHISSSEKNDGESRNDSPSQQTMSDEDSSVIEHKAPTTPGSKSRRTFSNKLFPQEVMKNHERAVTEVMKELDSSQNSSIISEQKKRHEARTREVSLESSARNINISRSVVSTTQGHVKEWEFIPILKPSRSGATSNGAEKPDPLFQAIRDAESSSSSSSVENNNKGTSSTAGNESGKLQFADALRIAKEALEKSNVKDSLRNIRRKASSNASVASTWSSKIMKGDVAIDRCDASQTETKNTKDNTKDAACKQDVLSQSQKSQISKSLSRRKQFLSGNSVCSIQSMSKSSTKNKSDPIGNATESSSNVTRNDIGANKNNPIVIDREDLRTSTENIMCSPDDEAGSIISYRTAPLPSNKSGRLRSMISGKHDPPDSPRDPPAAGNADASTRFIGGDSTPVAKPKPDTPPKASPATSTATSRIANRIRTFPAEKTDKHQKQHNLQALEVQMDTIIEFNDAASLEKDAETHNSACFEVILRDNQ